MVNDGARQRLYDYASKHGPLLGIHELAQVLGMSKQAVSNRMTRGSLPPPDYRLAATSVWRTNTVDKWLQGDPLK